MNKTIIAKFAFVCFLFTQINVSAQNNEEAKTLFGNGNPIKTKDLGVFLAPSLSFTQMDGSAATLFNLRGGIGIKDKVSIGAYFNTSLNQIKPQNEVITDIYMDYWTVGGFAEYTLLSKKIFHLTFPLYIGYGEVQMDSELRDVELGEANFFKIEPSALLEVNLHKYVRFNVGAGYRIVDQVNFRGINQSDLSGLTGYVGLRFGLFR